MIDSPTESTAAPRAKRSKDATKKADLTLAKEGKKFESNLLPKIKKWCVKRKAVYARFYDAHTAMGSKLPPQASDCHLTFSSVGHYVEVKFVGEQWFSCSKMKDRQFEAVEESLECLSNYWVLVWSKTLDKYFLLDSVVILRACGGKRIIRSAEWDLQEVFADRSFHKYQEALEFIRNTPSIHDAKPVLI